MMSDRLKELLMAYPASARTELERLLVERVKELEAELGRPSESDAPDLRYMGDGMDLPPCGGCDHRRGEHRKRHGSIYACSVDGCACKMWRFKYDESGRAVPR